MGSEDLLREAFELNSYEARLYVALLGEGMKPAEASRVSGVPLSRTYDTLRSLQQKGFVTEAEGSFKSTRPSTALESRIMRYVAQFDSEQSNRRDAMKHIVDDLEPRIRKSAADVEPVMLKGLDSISTAFLEVLSSSSEVYLIVRKGLQAKASFMGLLRQAGKQSAAVRLLLPADHRISKEDLRAATNLGLKIRQTEGTLIDMMAGDRGGVIIGVPARGIDESFGAVAIWVKSQSFAESVIETLAAQWKAARQP